MRQRILAMGEQLREMVTLNEELLRDHDTGDIRKLEIAWAVMQSALDGYQDQVEGFDALLVRFKALDVPR